MTAKPIESCAMLLSSAALVVSALFTPLVAPVAAQESESESASVREMAIGEPDAPVTVIEYASFTCPHCATSHKTVFPELKRAYVDTGKVRFVYREVYFDRPGLWASLVARCGGGAHFFDIVDRIYSTQAEWTAVDDPASMVAGLREIGLSFGLTEPQLESCISDQQKAEALVQWFRDNARADEISSTPSFVINGEKFSNMPFETLSAEIDSRLPDQQQP